MELFLSTVNISVQKENIFPKLDLAVLKLVRKDRMEHHEEEKREEKWMEEIMLGDELRE